MRIGKFVSTLTLAALLVGVGIGCATLPRTPPPSPKTEVKPPKPFANAVWIDGHWKHTRHGWVWVSGHWEKQPRSGAVWVSGKWVKTPRGWKWKPGHWK
jgi:hypothetical protein